MTKWHYLALLSALPFWLSSCSVFQQQNNATDASKEEEKEKIPPPMHLGAVHQVIPERNFAILRIIGPMPREGAVLISHPADGSTDRMGNLMVSGGQHRRGNIIVADIRSGTVIKGDRVFLYRSIAESNGEETAPDDNDITEETDVQPDTGSNIPLPDFDNTSAVSDVGHTPFSSLPPEPDETQQDTQPEPEPQKQLPPAGGIPDKLQDVPDTLDGWD